MMYTIKPTAEFKRDYRRAQQKGLDMGPLNAVITALAAGETLPAEYRDRPLSGDMQGYRECQVQPNRLLVYYIEGEMLVLTLLRTGSREEVYHREGANGMKPTKSLKSLYRSPVKTAVTLLLLAATAFLFLYNLAEYSVADREYREARDKYEGVLTFNGEIPPETADPWYDFFLHTDSTNPGRTYGRHSYEEWHQESLTAELTEELSSLQYISDMERRYMTAGVSPDYYRMDADHHFFPHASRCVLVATIEDKADEWPSFASLFYVSPLWKWFLASVEDGGQKVLTLKECEVLAGDPGWLWGGEPQYLRIKTPDDEHRDEYVQMFEMDYSATRTCMLSIDPHLYLEDVEALTPGRRYVFVLRNNLAESNSVPFKEGEKVHGFVVGDDSLTDWWPYFTDITDRPENWLETEEFADLRELIQVTNDDVHTFDVVYGDDMKSIRRVADGRIVCDQGRFLGPEDAGQPVCVVSTDFLKTNGLKVGDSITLNLGNYLSEPYAPLGAVAVNRGRYSTEFTEQKFTIIGAWRDLNEGNHIVRDWFWCWSNNAIFVPSAFLPDCVNADTYTPKPNDVSFVVGNAENIEAFQKKVLPQLENMGLNCSFYDWGWSDVGPDLIQARNLARIKLLIFVGAAVMAMLLTVWLFIGRKKREFGILRALGMPRKEASRWLFTPFLCLGTLSALLGAAAAGWMNGRQLGQMAELREKTAPAGAAVYILGAIGFLLVLALLAWGDIFLIRRKSILELVRADDGAPERRKRAAEVSAEIPTPAAQWVSHDLGGSKSPHWRGRYLRRLLGRNPVRSSLSLILAGLLVVAFGLLTVLRGIYAELYKNVEVKPVITGGMTYERAEKIAESGYVRDPYYEFVCQSGEVEIRGDQVNVYLTNHLERLVSAAVDWLPGWDADTAMNVNEKVCVIFASWAAELGKDLGDDLRIEEVGWFQKVTNNGLDPLKAGETVEDRRDATRPTVTIVGLIQGEELDTSVYLPAAAWRYFGCFMPGGKLDLAEYALVDYHKAAEFTDYVKDVFSRIKDPLALNMDTSYADRIYKIHRLIEELYPLAVAAALILGCVLPGLAVLHSSKEISILRALGVRAKDCVILYTLSQVLCALAGLVLGIAAVLVALRPELSAVVVPFAVYVSAHLAACALGSGVFAWLCARKRVLEQLQAKE